MLQHNHYIHTRNQQARDCETETGTHPLHDGRGVDGDGCDECQNHVHAERESSASHRCEVTPIQMMAMKDTVDPKENTLHSNVACVRKARGGESKRREVRVWVTDNRKVLPRCLVHE